MSNTILETPTTIDTKVATPAPPPGGGATGGDKAPQGAAPKASIPTATTDHSTVLASLVEQLVKQNMAKAEVTKKVAATKAGIEEIDWSKINEKDLLSLSIPIPTIDHALEGYLDVHLADKNYVARWVHKSVHNLGPKLNRGYTYVTAEDMDKNYPAPLPFDSEGHYSFDDVVCLKIHKSLHLSKLKANLTSAQEIPKTLTTIR